MKTIRATLSTALIGAVSIAAMSVPATASADPGPASEPLIDVSKLPLATTARWLPVHGSDTDGPVLRAIVRCQPQAKVSGTLQPERPVDTAWLRPAGDALGWQGSVSGARYRDPAAARSALAAYTEHLQPCVTGRTGNPHGIRTTTAVHLSLDVGDSWLEVFAVTAEAAVVETVLSHPKSGPTAFGANTSQVFDALRRIDMFQLNYTRVTDGPTHT